jgi:hypothetical protein
MKNHWREVHNWSVGRKDGRLSQLAQKKIQLRIDNGCRRVHCQRLLQYFEVQLPNDDDDDPAAVPVDSNTAWARVSTEMAEALERVKKQAASTIQAGERDEVNPWVERACTSLPINVSADDIESEHRRYSLALFWGGVSRQPVIGVGTLPLRSYSQIGTPTRETLAMFTRLSQCPEYGAKGRTEATPNIPTRGLRYLPLFDLR